MVVVVVVVASVVTPVVVILLQVVNGAVRRPQLKPGNQCKQKGHHVLPLLGFG